MSNRKTPVFVFGTLQDKTVQLRLTGREFPVNNVILYGYKKVGLNIIEDEKSFVNGQVLEVDDWELSRFDEYEGIAQGLYKKIMVDIEGYGSIMAYQLVDSSFQIISPFTNDYN